MFILVPVVGSCLCTPVAELSRSQPKPCGPDPKMCTACPFTDDAGCLKPGPGFFTCNICATPWVSWLHSSGSRLAALCHAACPPRAPHIRCEEAGVEKLSVSGFHVMEVKYAFSTMLFFRASHQGSSPVTSTGAY